MELSILDPFGDYKSAGYLRNAHGEHDLQRVGHLETAVFQSEVVGTVRYLRRVPVLGYEDVLETHRQLFLPLYPWAGQDRSVTAPAIAIVKGGYNNLFSHPAGCRLAAEYALRHGQDLVYLRAHPGEVFGYLAHAHPFLEGNGRTILTIFAELTRRAGFHIVWEALDKREFLDALTKELLEPGLGTMDRLIVPYMREGALTEEMTVWRLRVRFER